MFAENLNGNGLGLGCSLVGDADVMGFDDGEVGLFPPLVDFEVGVEFGFENMEADKGHIDFLFDVVVEDVIGGRRGQGEKKTFRRKIQDC